MLREFVNLIAPIQILFRPGFFFLVVYFTYRTIVKKDRPAGVAFYISLVIIVDQFMQGGIKIIPGLESGRLYYSEVLWLVLFFQQRSSGQDVRYQQGSIYRLAFYFYAALLMLQIFNVQPYITRLEVVTLLRRELLPQIMVFMIASRGFEKKEDYIQFFRYLSVLILIFILYLLWDKYRDMNIIKSVLLNKKNYAYLRAGRHGSIMMNPNNMGEIVALLFPIYLYFYTTIKEKKILYLLCAGGLLFLLSQSQARAAIVGLAVGILFYITISTEKFKLISKTALVVIALIVVMPGFFDKMLARFTKEKMEQETKGEGHSRGNTARQTLLLISDHPFGIGWGEWTYISYASEYRDFGEEVLDNPHNSFLYIAVVGGIQALIVFLVLFGVNFFRSLKVMKNHPTGIYGAITTGQVSFLIAIAASPSIFVVRVAAFYWLIFGFLLSLLDLEQGEEQNEEGPELPRQGEVLSPWRPRST